MLLFFVLLLSLTQEPSGAIRQIEEALSKGTTTASNVLSNPSYMSLHTHLEFRNVIKKHAKAGPLNIVTPNEPGQQAVIKGKLVSGNGPVGNTLIYAYQTDKRGWYNEQREDGQSHARLFGYFRTNPQGEFEFNTIRPGSYPNSRIPQHIHLEIYSADGSALLITELLFDDDPELTGQTREQYLRQGYAVAKNTGTKEKQRFEYVVRIR